jgi:hypothetical protein
MYVYVSFYIHSYVNVTVAILEYFQKPSVVFKKYFPKNWFRQESRQKYLFKNIFIIIQPTVRQKSRDKDACMYVHSSFTALSTDNCLRLSTDVWRMYPPPF